MFLNLLIKIGWITLLFSSLPAVIATIGRNKAQLLNADRVPLAAMTSPGNFYFLHFPVDENDPKTPSCSDGSPYSFAFRRGTDEHISKILIEFEGGPACWKGGNNQYSCVDFDGYSSNMRRQTPWNDYLDYFNYQVILDKTFPALGSCRGITSGFFSEASDVILSTDNAFTNDVPIPLRVDQGNGWWESIGGLGSDIRDWSYILLPHCTMDLHLGHGDIPKIYHFRDDEGKLRTKSVYHRGGTNVDAVIKWIKRQFPSGLDALVAVSGGKIGGCDVTVTPNIAPAILASKLSSSENDEEDASPFASSRLVVMEGSNMWGQTSNEFLSVWKTSDNLSGDSLSLPGSVDNLVSSLLKSNGTQIIWMASDEDSVSEEETLWSMKQTNIHGEKFHVYHPTSKQENKTEENWCPLYTLPDDNADFSDFFSDVIQRMPWSTAPSSTNFSTSELLPSLTKNDVLLEDERNSRSRLTLLSISVMLGGMVLLAWIVYFFLEVKQSQSGGKSPLSPSELWFIALTKHPLAFFVISLLVPIILSTIAFSRNELRINMDFDSYLQVNTQLENVRRNYIEAQENQQASLEIEEANCRLYGHSLYGNYRKLSNDENYGDHINDMVDFEFNDEQFFGNRKLLDGLDLDIQIEEDFQPEMISLHHRKLSLANLNYFSGGEWVSIMYQNRKGGNVFEPDVLKAIHEFENSIYDFPGFGDYCYGHARNHCLPIDSLVSLFFNNGNLVSDIDGVLRSFLVNRPALWKLDQYFGPNNLQSNVTRSFVFLRNMGGDQSAAHPFLRSFYRDFLLKHAQKKTYPEMVHTWNNFVLKQTEADDALLHDTLWSIASLFFISTMILLKVQSFFVAFFSILGLVLAFSVAYYWVSAHLLITNVTIIWVAGLFVMLGIGADDIFLMVDSFDHTKHEYEQEFEDFEISRGDHSSNDKTREDLNLDILRKRMKVAYKKAGSMMLVSSVTTAICFFSNAFGVLTVIQEFGIYMGMVVLVNYLHVMTILPSSILVNEIYVVPIQGDFNSWFKHKVLNMDQDEQHDNHSNNVQMESGDDVHNHKKSKHDLNNLDRYLVQTYAPHVTKKSSYLLYFPIILAIFLGVAGGFNFSLNDGSIVLFSSRYNLGRLEEVTDRYYNADEDVYTTIENDTPEPTFPPARAPTPAPAPTTPPADNVTYQSMNVSINWVDPEEAVKMGLPGAITLPPELSGSSNYNQTSNSNQSQSNGNSEKQQVGGYDSNKAPQQNSEIQHIGGADSDDSNQATQSTQVSENKQVEDDGSDDPNQATQQTQPSETQQIESDNSDDPNQATQQTQPSETQQIESDNSDDLNEVTQQTQTSETQQIESDDSDDLNEATQQIQPSEIQQIESDKSDDPNKATQQTQPSETQQIESDDSDDPNQTTEQNQPSETQQDRSNDSDDSNQATQQTSQSGNQEVIGNSSGGSGSSGSTNGSSSAGGSYSDAKQQQTSNAKKQQVQTSGGDAHKQPTNERNSASTMRRRETIQVKLIWGIDSLREKPSLWITDSGEKHFEVGNDDMSSPSLKLADPRTQDWLMKVVNMARDNPNLFVREDKATWIERLADFAQFAGVEFPIPERLFTTYLQLAKSKDDAFADLIDNEIGTSAPGLGGDFTFASIAMNVDAVLVANAAKNVSMSEYIYKEWTEFAALTNQLSSEEMPDVVAQSSIFLDAYRVEATIDSTLMTWFVANGLCLLVILVFIQNLALSVMVMVTILLILFCLGGLFFAVYRLPFGPVEALGVSIFIGLSANYSLHVVHAYHHAKGGNRQDKIGGAIFAVGSPIIASALSTMGASAFLFACRTWIFIELGLLICSITGMALCFTMTFLLAWLVKAGPVPIKQYGQKGLHQWDLKLLYIPFQKQVASTVDTTKDQSDENASVYSIEIVDLGIGSRNIEHGKNVDDDDNDSVYSIEVIDDSNCIT